ncbi:MAG: UPF0158 family protein [Thermoanaerobaculia bacterium]
MNIDWEGIVVAFESRSQLITHFLDRETGEVLQVVRDRDPRKHEELTASPRFLAVPTDHGERGVGEMELFLAEVEKDALRAKLRSALASPEPALAYREALLTDAREESRFFQFKQRHARERAEAWLASMGIPFEKRAEPAKADREFPGGAPGGPRKP